MRKLTRLLVLAVSLSCTARALHADEEPATDAVVKSELRGQMHIAQPVGLLEPANKFPHVCQVDDVYVFPIQYPISPPFPKSAEASSDGAAIVAKDVVRASGLLTYLTSKPQTGGRLGVGYLLLIVKAAAPGTAHAKIKVTLADGTVKEVRFKIKVEEAAKE